MSELATDVTNDLAALKRFAEKANRTWRDRQTEEERRNHLLAYDSELLPNVRYSAQDFYELVLANLTAQEVPGLESEYVMIRQGGPATPQRLYLQLRRERIFIEVCAMQFGTGFFISRRDFQRRLRGPVVRLLGGLFLLATISGFVGLRVGWLYGFLTFTGLLALLLSLMRLAAGNAAATLDRAFSDLPVLGPVYEMLFHPATFFREDTNRAYREAVKDAVNEAKKQIKEPKGSRASFRSSDGPVVEELHRK